MPTYTTPQGTVFKTGAKAAQEASTRSVADLAVRNWVPTGVISENVPRGVSASVTDITLTSGTLYLTGGLVIPAFRTVTTATFNSGSVAMNGPTNQWAVLVDQSLNVLQKSADRTNAAWGTTALQSFTFAGYTPTVDTPVYCGLVVTASTAVNNLRGMTTGGAVLALTPKYAGNTASTGLTNPASLGATAGAITTGSAVAYCSLS